MNKFDQQTIVVAGAGIIGCCAAWALSRRGFQVVLVDERSAVLQGISTAGFGSLTPFSDPFYRGEARDFAVRAVGFYRDGWLQELSRASQQSIEFCDNGLLQLCLDSRDVDRAENQVRELMTAGYEAQILSPEETRHLEPALAGNFQASLWMNEPWLDRDQYFAAISAALSREPKIAQYFNNAVVEVCTGPEYVTVITSSGSRIACSGVVICNGLTTSTILGIQTIPLKWVRGDAIALHSTTSHPILTRHVYCHEGFITPRKHSELLLGTTYEPEILPSEYARQHRDRILLSDFNRIIAANTAILPSLEQLDVARVWRNWRPTPPDNNPILGPSSNDPRIIIANGFIGLGLTLGPAVGDSIASYFSQSEGTAFPRSFSPSRVFSP